MVAANLIDNIQLEPDDPTVEQFNGAKARIKAAEVQHDMVRQSCSRLANTFEPRTDTNSSRPNHTPSRQLEPVRPITWPEDHVEAGTASGESRPSSHPTSHGP